VLEKAWVAVLQDRLHIKWRTYQSFAPHQQNLLLYTQPAVSFFGPAINRHRHGGRAAIQMWIVEHVETGYKVTYQWSVVADLLLVGRLWAFA
jgi:hypothetical protein